MSSRLAIAAAARNWLVSGRNFVFPPSCLCCGGEITGDVEPHPFCVMCLLSLQGDVGPECQKCAAPVGPYLDTSQGCHHCRTDRFRFQRVIRLGVYREHLAKSIRQAKSAMGDGLSRALTDLLWLRYQADWAALPCDVVVPIPHHWTRRFSLQPSASETIAERLAWHLKLPVDRRLLRKVRWTPSQAGSPPSARRQQQKNAFVAAEEIRGWQVLLVDDVLTTGSTADEAAKALLARGAASVTVVVIARGLGEHA